MTPRISNNLTIILHHSQGYASIVEGEGYPNGRDGIEQVHNAYHHV